MAPSVIQRLGMILWGAEDDMEEISAFCFVDSQKKKRDWTNHANFNSISDHPELVERSVSVSIATAISRTQLRKGIIEMPDLYRIRNLV
jgi:hypothetical protein